jgi:beta-lactamase regulating signal transducer with metallopeptidase domain
MTAAINLEELARISAGRMLNSMLEGIAIGLFAWILLRLVGRRNSSTRFAVWFSALLAIAFLPVISGAASSQGSAGSAITVPGSWALGVFTVWASIAAVCLTRVGVGLWQLRKLRASCIAIDPKALDPQLRATLQAFQSVRSVELCQSDRLHVPTAMGFLKPLVVIPAWATQELSTAELNSILIHELAHLRRWDDWTNLAQQVLKALLFFHPAVWWIENKLALEREMACDDAVLAETANPKAYAQCLVALAEKSFVRRGLAMAQAAVNRIHQTSLRVSQILDVNRPSATRVWKPALYSVAAFSVVCLASLSRAPELVTFEGTMPEIAVASATPANEVWTSASDSGFTGKQTVATPVVFHPESTTEKLLQTHRIRKGAVQPADRLRLQVTKRSLRCDSCAQVDQGFSPELAEVSFSAVFSDAPQRAENDSELQPLRRENIVQPNLSADASAGLSDPKLQQRNLDDLALVEKAPSIEDEVAPQTILVVMQTEEYRQAGPMLLKLSVWHVLVFDSSNIPVEGRIPAKQI